MKIAEAVPGVYDALTALLCEASGFRTLFVSGAALHATTLGREDLGLTTATELADVTARIRDRVGCTLIVDADAGYGSIHNLQRTVTTLERAGANVIQIEDQLAIKPVGQSRSRPVAPAAEMVDRIKAAVDSRRSTATLISARTDATPSLGIGHAIERALLYSEAGADLLFVQSLAGPAQEALVSVALSGLRPLVIHPVRATAEPDIDLAGLGAQGFVYALRPDVLVRAVVGAIGTTLVAIGGSAPPDLATVLAGATAPRSVPLMRIA